MVPVNPTIARLTCHRRMRRKEFLRKLTWFIVALPLSEQVARSPLPLLDSPLAASFPPTCHHRFHFCSLHCHNFDLPVNSKAGFGKTSSPHNSLTIHNEFEPSDIMLPMGIESNCLAHMCLVTGCKIERASSNRQSVGFVIYALVLDKAQASVCPWASREILDQTEANS